MLVTDYIIEYLRRNEGVTHAFTYVGGTNAPLMNSLHHAEGIDFVAHRHEQSASLAAVGYSLAAEKLGVAISMSGPGATNMITGIADAWFDSKPVLYLTGQVTRSSYKFDNPARQMGYQETDIVTIVRSITKAAEMVTDENQIPAVLRDYIGRAKTDRKGPVLLDVPFDVLRADIPEDGMDDKALPRKAPRIGEEVVEAAARMIAKAERPIIIAGAGVRTAKTREILHEFATTLAIPVVTSLNGKDAFPNDSELYFGFIGAYGNRYANIAMANSDLVLAVGSRLDSRQIASGRTFARAARKIHVDVDKHELNNNLVVDLPVWGDLEDFLPRLLEQLPPAPVDKYAAWMAHHAKTKAAFDVITDVVGPAEDVNPKRFLRELSLSNTERTVYLADVGNNGMFSAQALVVRQNQKFMVSGGLGTMGFAIPASIGACYGDPGARVVAIMGDGGFQMASMELETIAHNQLPIKLVVLNNRILGLMKVFQDENYKGSYPATMVGYSVPDLGKLAAAYGLEYMKVDDDEEARECLPAFWAAKGPLILDVTVHRDWTGYPKTRRGLPVEYQNPAIPDDRLREFMLIPLHDESS